MNNRLRPLFKIAIAIVFFGCSQITHSQDNKEKILFVGNSFTYFNNMPQMVEAMARAEDDALLTRQSTVGGSNLMQHLKAENGTKTQRMLDSTAWDIVLLQDHSVSTIEDPKRFQEAVTGLVEQVKSKKGKPVLSMTWSYINNPLMQSTISAAYEKVGKELNVPVVPVGNVFMKARELRPDLDMYFDDKHPSPEASYLIALTFYKYLTGKSVMHIPTRLMTQDIHGDMLYLCFILPSDAAFLKQLVEEYDMPIANMKK